MTKTKISLPLLFLILTIALCSIAEIVLLEVKYQLFAGGFLQAHQVSTLGDRVIFILAFLIFNIILYGGLYKVWQLFLKKFKINNTIIAFHFMMIAGIITAISLVVQYQLNKYFADAMDMALIKNIAGGELKTALLYVMDEAVLLVIGAMVLIAAYFLVYKLFEVSFKKHTPIDSVFLHNPNVLKALGTFIFVLCFSAFLVMVIDKFTHLSPNLKRSNSYSLIISVLNFVSDFDGDGYGSFRSPRDTSIFDSTIHPNALDIPNNNIDEDGFLGDFKNYTPYENYTISATTAKKHKHVITVIMESARGDLIGKKLDGELVAPNITALSQKGQFVQEAFSHTGFTSTSVASFFSGRIGSFKKEESLFPILKNRGYQIAVFSGQDETWGELDKRLSTRHTANYFYDAQTGVEERVFASKLPSSIKLSEETLWNEFKIYSDNLNWNNPQFIYFNMQAGHFPYYHGKMINKFVKEGIPRSEISLENRDYLRRTYWNAMSHADFYFGKIVSELKEKNQWDDTLLVLIGDHGEELFDEGHLGHGFFSSKVQTHIPLVISQKDLSITQPVGLADMRNLILSYIIANNDNQDIPQNNPKFVFQYVGDLNSPNTISLRYHSDDQITLDLKNLTVQRTDNKEWISYKEAINNPDIKQDLEKLILHWENLRWQDKVVNQAMIEVSQ